MLEIHDVCGVEVRVTDVVPEEIVGVNNSCYLVLFWEGAEIARIMPHCSNQYAGEQEDGY